MNEIKSVDLVRRRNLRTVCSEVAVLLASAFVLSMAHPSFLSNNGFGFLAFVALIPVFAVIRNTSWKLVGLYGFLYGLVYYAIFNYWLVSFHPYAILIVTIIKATEMLMLFIALKAASSWLGDKYGYLAQAIIWVAYSYLSQSWFAGYPYGTLAYALFRYKVLIQIADLAGIWGINFMLVLPQAFLGMWVCDNYSHTKIGAEKTKILDCVLKNKIILICWTVLFVFQIVYGIITLSSWKNEEPDKTWRVATIQHNADSWKGGYETYARNFNNLKKMSLEALRKDPDMIIWSETAFIPSVDWYTNYPYEGTDEGDNFDYLRKIQDLVNQFVDFGTGIGVPLLTGNPSGEIGDPNSPPYTETGEWNKTDYNSVILFDDGEIKQNYRKQHLVPFTEHFPYEKQMPWLYNLLKANGYHWWEKGTESVVFETSNGITFSTPICFEDVFGDLNAAFVRSGADLIVNMTNDSWSGSVAAERQHLAMAIFRSVENRRTTVRGTNSGISCVITPDGSVKDEMEPFKMYWHIYDVPVFSNSTHPLTVYTKIADLSALVCVYLSFALLAFGGVWTILKRKRIGK